MKTLLFLLFIPVCIYAQKGRDRVSIQNGTIVTDRGTLLRGAYISTDYTNTIASKSEISAIKNLGLNCIHLYAECSQFQEPGDRVLLVDSVINMAEEDSLYVIMTIGGCDQNGQFDSAFVYDFWNFYAPRYADKTHVIFEIMNEPFSWSAPYDATTLEMEKWAYQLIRSHAPATHILLMSYASAVNELSIVEDLRSLDAFVDWGNASLAMHGYGTASENFRELIRTVKDSGYAFTITEPESIENTYVNLATTRVFEEEHVSYTHFINVRDLVNDPSLFTDRIESSELQWEPDFGTWPQSITAIHYINPYTTIEAGFYDEGYGLILQYGQTTFGFISNNDYLAYYNLDFQKGPVSFETECSSAGAGGNIELHLDSLNGTLAGTCPVTPTGNWDTYATYSCDVSHFDGIHKLYMLFRGNNYDLMNFRSFVFNKAADLIDQESSSGKTGYLIYPVPADADINIAIENDCRAEIYNLRGQLLISKTISPAQSSIDVSRLPSGSYVLTLRSGSTIISEIFSVR
jgi:hypothetical protein